MDKDDISDDESSNPSPQNVFQSVFSTSKTKRIDRSIVNSGRKEAEKIKLLLLGAGESGKSTFVKQMKIIHTEGYTLVEQLEYRNVVIANTIQSLAAILKGMQVLKISYSSIETESMAKVFLFEVDELNFLEVQTMPEHLYNAMKKLWIDSGVRKCFERSKEYQLNDSAAYFLDALDRISDEDYIPTEDDILRTRVKTTTISEMTFVFKNMLFCMYDVGGQRTERRKWIHCFDNVTSVFFLAAISGYDQTLEEDPTTNRLKESIRLFESICNNRWFEETSMVLFLNKVDLFQKKIQTNPLSQYFVDYEGSFTDFEENASFILKKFLDKNQRAKTIYSHFTCATNTDNVNVVFTTVVDIIVMHQLKDINMI
ncbi:hypothetical protein TCAL_11259 [Tigriopus californicus]|uniref:Guanine nucleotide-binding protein alpha-16 subunit n=2 Tax=Tigriopus californicus TaxID=6832 RepID=A0A553NBE3_TIGCA|nr:hypothetical protein TCAL_11259 [Tigriopus californicus]|eukprot:TCALIF_11259-PA protein Name:"Similar to gnai2 Guanine nucleotide-binding protein G(i) subunit alpha-2 (Oryzias latipes)" AED:0.18 eAED:0.18 QI:0/0.5/0/1/1/1/5/0/369